MSDYKFDPLNFGFAPLAEFPAIMEDLSECMNPLRFKWTYIKIKAIGGREFQPAGRVVLWYTLCDIEDAGGLERVTFYSSSFDSSDEEPKQSYEMHARVYFGTVNSVEFAYPLLENLHGGKWHVDLNQPAKSQLATLQ